MASKTFRTTLKRDTTSVSAVIPVPFDPKPVFGKVRAPVRVTLNGYTFCSTIAAYSGEFMIPFRASHREAAGLDGTETLQVTLDLDDEPREVTPPADLKKALKAAPPAWERWNELSFTHQREYAQAVEDAKKPETRLRRIESAVKAIGARPAKKRK